MTIVTLHYNCSGKGLLNKLKYIPDSMHNYVDAVVLYFHSMP